MLLRAEAVYRESNAAKQSGTGRVGNEQAGTILCGQRRKAGRKTKNQALQAGKEQAGREKNVLERFTLRKKQSGQEGMQVQSLNTESISSRCV